MHQQVRMIKAVLEQDPVSIIDVCRRARVWPSTAKFFLESEAKSGRLIAKGSTPPDKCGRTFPLYRLKNARVRKSLALSVIAQTKKDWGSLVDNEEHTDLLEPPGALYSVLTAAMMDRRILPAERALQLDGVWRLWSNASAASFEVYDDTGRGDEMIRLYSKLALCTLLLSQNEIVGHGPTTPVLCHSFREIAGGILLLSDEHAKIIARVAAYWRESPLLRAE